MKVERITEIHYTFQDGDIVAVKLGAGAIVATYHRIHNGTWWCNGHNTGLNDTDVKSGLENFPDKWRYVGNKYEVFQ